MDSRHSWRLSIRPEWIGGQVDGRTDSRMTNEARCMHTRILTAVDRHCAAHQGDCLHILGLTGAIQKVGQMQDVALKKERSVVVVETGDMIGMTCSCRASRILQSTWQGRLSGTWRTCLLFTWHDVGKRNDAGILMPTQKDTNKFLMIHVEVSRGRW